ncbi:MAG: VWA domain-containing protein [Planctomycetota bacterium]|jgi:hypothetical protein
MNGHNHDCERRPDWLSKTPSVIRKSNSVLASVIFHSLVLVSMTVISARLIHSDKEAKIIKIHNERKEEKFFEKKKIEILRIRDFKEFSEDPGVPLELLKQERELEAMAEKELHVEKDMPSEKCPRSALIRNDASEFIDTTDMDNYAKSRKLLALEAKSKKKIKKKIRKKKPRRPKPEEEELGSASTFFGSKVGSKRILFVIDVSGSMSEVGTYWSSGNSSKLKGSANKHLVRCQKIELAKMELRKCVAGMNNKTRFNILAYSDKVRKPFTQMRLATPENIDAALEFINGLSANGSTDTCRAFREAFLEKQADTVFLLSDGAPTTGAAAGKNARNQPQNQSNIMGTFANVTKANRKRKLKIHTFGFEKKSAQGTTAAEAEFMRRLAKHNQGRYISIR